jgi:hypothetical protein
LRSEVGSRSASVACTLGKNNLEATEENVGPHHKLDTLHQSDKESVHEFESQQHPGTYSDEDDVEIECFFFSHQCEQENCDPVNEGPTVVQRPLIPDTDHEHCQQHQQQHCN